METNMPGKTVPLSVRISDEDASFLARLDIEGAVTPSEKLRALLTSERRLREGGGDPADAEEMLEDLCRPARRRLRRAEKATGQRSEVAQKLYDRVPKLAALALTGPPQNKDASPDKALADWEGQWVELALALCEDLLHVGLVSDPRSFNKHKIKENLAPIIELAELVKIADKQGKGELNE
jgi:hypothetical protein